MLKKTITYVDYDGNQRTEDFYFNLSKAEITEMQFGVDGGLEAQLKRIVETKNQPAIIREFKNLVLKAYGEKSDDGRHFMKSPEIAHKFECSEAYSIIFMELATDANKAAEFVNAVIPKVEEKK